MPAFVEELWNSIFTPGTTPTLLLATNTTFAALQILLAVLLLFTHSLHFLILSALSAGLWGSVNWFAAEIARQAETQTTKTPRTEKERPRPAKKQKKFTAMSTSDLHLSSAAEGDDEAGGAEGTESGDGMNTEDAASSSKVDTAVGKSTAMHDWNDDKVQLSKIRVRGGPQKLLGVQKSANEAREAGSEAPLPALSAQTDGMRATRSSLKDSVFSVTDSDWEKVSRGEDESASST